MSESPGPARRNVVTDAVREAAPVLALLVLLTLATLLPPDLAGVALRLESADRTRANGMDAAFDRLPERALGLVAFGVDLPPAGGVERRVRGCCAGGAANLKQ